MTAELHSAFVWDCDECGAENFERAIEGDLDEAAMSAICDRDEGEPAIQLLAPNADEGADGLSYAAVLISRVSMVPRWVECKQCSKKYETEIACETDDYDDLDN